MNEEKEMATTTEKEKEKEKHEREESLNLFSFIPFKKLFFKSRTSKFTSDPKEDGRVPLNSFPDKFRYCSFRSVQLVGRVEENVFPAKFSSRREGSPVTHSGKDLSSLPKMSGVRQAAQSKMERRDKTASSIGIGRLKPFVPNCNVMSSDNWPISVGRSPLR
tara:strand:+ start:236 stop:721 length:486 start_codon:yes stop_codon:yes gene_type:complete